MPCVTLLVTGVPRYALLENLSRNLDLLFDTDEIGTFKLRNLPNHPRTNKRQVAIDFRSGFDAMAAQAKLDTFEYEYNGEMYTLSAKINKIKEYRSGSFSPERLEDDWQWPALQSVPNVCYDENMYRATHSKLNARLALLRKQKLIVEAERELLREKRKLKREYGSTDGHDSEHEATTSKHCRQGSRGRRSGSKGRRSESWGRRSESRERRSRSRGRRSRSKGRRSGSRGRRSWSKVRRSGSKRRRSGSRRRRSWSRGRRSRSRRRRSGSKERRSGSRRRCSKSREGHVVRGSKERRTRSRDRSRPRFAWDDRTRQLRSPSKESPDPIPIRSQSHETHASDRSMSRELRDLRSLILSKRDQKSRERLTSDETVQPKIERPLRDPRSSDRDRKSRERSKSEEKVQPKTERPLRDPRSSDPERYHREKRSQSYERDYRDHIVSRERDRERRSTSKERAYGYYIHSRERVHRDRRSTSRSRNYTERRSKKRAGRKSRSRKRRTKSRDPTHVDDVIVLPRSLVYGVQRSRTPDYRHRHQLAIMPNPERSEAPREWSLDAHRDANEPPMMNVTINEDETKNINCSPTVKHTQVANIPKEKSKNCAPKECDANIPKKHTENIDVNADNVKCENIENTPQIKGKISETNDPTIIIDIDSPDKPVPKRPKFLLVIKPLVKDMKRVIVNNNLTQLIKISDLEYVLRRTLRDLLKGQGYLPNKEIRNKFRALHPKEKDDQFIKNVIEDIKNGKYPILTGLPTTDDCEDDVILMEKKYDVVTVDDSDDDDDDADVAIIREQEATPQIPTHYPVDSSLEITGTASLGTTNIGPEKHELVKDKPTTLGTATLVPVVSGSTNLGPFELGPNPSPCNPAQVNSSPSNFGATEVPTNPTASRWDLVNPCSVNLDPNEPAHNPTSRSIQPGSTVFIPASGNPKLVTGNPETSKLRLVNPDEAHSSAGVRTAPGTSKLVKANPDTSKLLVINRGTANPRSAVVRLAPGTSKLVTANPDTSEFMLANQVSLRTSNIRPLYRSPPTRPTYVSPSNVTVTQLRPTNPSTSRWDLIKPRSAKFTPFKLKPKIVEIKTGSSNLAQVNSGPSNDTQVKLNRFNIPQVYPDPSNHDATELRPTNPRTSRWDLVNPGSANHSATAFRPKPGSSNALQVIPGLYDLEQANLDPLNVARVNPVPTNSSTNFGPVSPGACKFLPACLRPTEHRPALATPKIRILTPGLATGEVKTMSQDSQITEKANIDKTGIMADTDKGKANKNDTKTVKDETENANNSEDVKRKTGENNSNSLKVTAITITTSLNELTKILDKTTDRSNMEVAVEDIKEEMPFENSEETDPTLSLDHLTSLTEIDNTKNVEDDRNKATERVEERNNNSLKVTAITIMTSFTELAAIADESTRIEIPVEVEHIKQEIEIETENSETIQINSTSKPASHESEEVNAAKSYDKEKASDEEETIESINKYVQSLM